MGIFGNSDSKPPEGPSVPSRPASPAPAEKERGAPAVAAVPSKPGTCIIAAKTVIKGELTGDEDVIVEGNVEGQIRITRDLASAPTASQGDSRGPVDHRQRRLVGDCRIGPRRDQPPAVSSKSAPPRS